MGIEAIQHNARTAWRTVTGNSCAWRAKGSFIVDRISPKLEQASCLARLGYYFFFFRDGFISPGGFDTT